MGELRRWLGHEVVHVGWFKILHQSILIAAGGLVYSQDGAVGPVIVIIFMVLGNYAGWKLFIDREERGSGG